MTDFVLKSRYEGLNIQVALITKKKKTKNKKPRPGGEMSMWIRNMKKKRLMIYKRTFQPHN